MKLDLKDSSVNLTWFDILNLLNELENPGHSPVSSPVHVGSSSLLI